MWNNIWLKEGINILRTKRFYKIIFKETGDISCYVKNGGNTDIASEICGLFGEGYIPEEITQEEYERDTADTDEGEEGEDYLLVRDEEAGVTIMADDGLHFIIDDEDDDDGNHTEC